MLTRRQNLLAVVVGAAFAGGLGPIGATRADDLTEAERAIGKPDAKTTVHGILLPDVFALRGVRRRDAAKSAVAS